MTKPYNDRLEQVEELTLLRSHVARVMLFDCYRNRRRYVICHMIYRRASKRIVHLTSCAVTPARVMIAGNDVSDPLVFRSSRRPYREVVSSLPAVATSSQLSLPGLASEQPPNVRRGWSNLQPGDE